MSTAHFVGLDVAKAQLDVAVRPSAERWGVPNDEVGIAQLVARLRALAPALVVAEATGGFERAAIAVLAAAGLPVVVANPLGKVPRRELPFREGRPHFRHLDLLRTAMTGFLSSVHRAQLI